MLEKSNPKICYPRMLCKTIQLPICSNAIDVLIACCIRYLINLRQLKNGSNKLGGKNEPLENGLGVCLGYIWMVVYCWHNLFIIFVRELSSMHHLLIMLFALYIYIVVL